MSLCYGRLRWGSTALRRETSPDPGRGLVSRISNVKEPQLPVVCTGLQYSACRKVLDHYVEPVRPLGCEPDRRTDPDESDDDVLSVGAIRPLQCNATCSATNIVTVDRDMSGTCCAQFDEFD